MFLSIVNYIDKKENTAQHSPTQPNLAQLSPTQPNSAQQSNQATTMSYPNQPDKVYYDLVISNLSGNLKGLPPPILFYNETRSTSLIYDPSSYYLSIVRFSLDTSTLPVFVPEIQLQQDNPNLTVYSFTISWTDPASGTTYDAQEYMKFIPQDETKEEPLPPSKTSNGFQDNSTGYYFVFNFQFIVFLINNTLDACYKSCLLYTSPSPRDRTRYRMPSSA